MPKSTVMSRTHIARRSLRLLLSLFLAVGASVGLSLVVQQPASAATVQPMSSIADCPAGDLCWWVSTKETGAMHPVRDAIYDWRTQHEPTCQVPVSDVNTWDDCASSLYNNNNKGFGAQVYSEPYPKGGSPTSSDPGYCLVPFSQGALNLSALHYSNEITLGMNDTISANRWRSGGC